MVEEADVLPQVARVHLGEGADERVGEHDTAHEVVGEVLLDRRADRFLKEDPVQLEPVIEMYK